MVIKRLLTNKFVLYFTVFLALMNVIGYIQKNDMKALPFFVVLGYLSSYFSKNMIINLAIAFLGTNVFIVNGAMREGLTDKERTDAAARAEEEEAKPMSDEEDDKNAEDFGMRTVKNSKKNRPYDDDDDGIDRIDSAATLEASYKNLESVLGKGGMRNLAKDTRSLVKQQKQLMQSVKHMNPMIKQLGGMVKGFGGVDGINSMMRNLKNLGGIQQPSKGNTTTRN